MKNKQNVDFYEENGPGHLFALIYTILSAQMNV